jgi:hypothetical protein
MSVNSTNSSAIAMTKNNGAITVNGGGRVSVTGDVSPFNGTISPSPSTSVPPSPDPFGSTPGPTVPASCDQINFKVNNNATISPGVYCNGIDIEKGTVTFKSGTYILCGSVPGQGTNFYLKGGNVKVIDDGIAGVLLYFTRCTIGGKTYDYATPIVMKASSDINLHGPTTGPYAGVVFFQDRNAPTTLTPSDWHASSTSELTGLAYFPSTGIDLATGGAVFRASALVTRSIHLRAQSLVDITNSFTGSPSPLHRVTLVE